MLRKETQTQKSIYWMLPFIETYRKCNRFYGVTQQISSWLGAVGEGESRGGQQKQQKNEKGSVILIAVIVSKVYTSVKTHQIVHLNIIQTIDSVQLIEYKLYLYKVVNRGENVKLLYLNVNNKKELLNFFRSLQWQSPVD